MASDTRKDPTTPLMIVRPDGTIIGWYLHLLPKRDLEHSASVTVNSTTTNSLGIFEVGGTRLVAQTLLIDGHRRTFLVNHAGDIPEATWAEHPDRFVKFNGFEWQRDPT